MSYHLDDKPIVIWQSEYDELIKAKQELATYKKTLELMAETIFYDRDCEQKYEECENLIIYQTPCKKCIDCIIEDYNKRVR